MSEANGHGEPGEGHRLRSLTLVPRAAARSATKDFKSDQEVRWCPGCGDYAILAAFQAFLPELEVPRENIVVISGIGCSSRLPVLREQLRDALDPRPRAGDRHRARGVPARPVGLGHHRRRRRAVHRRQPPDPRAAPQRQHQDPAVQQQDLRADQGPVLAHLASGARSPSRRRSARWTTRSTRCRWRSAPRPRFVARTIDSDRRHLTSVLRAAADHRGTAFVEIYQNCPIFNDDAFALLKQASATAERLIKLEHGEPVRFAGGTRGLRFGPHGELEAVEVAAAEGLGKSDAAAEGLGKSDAAAEGLREIRSRGRRPRQIRHRGRRPRQIRHRGRRPRQIGHRGRSGHADHSRRAPRRPVLRVRAVAAGHADFRHTPVGVFRQVEQASYDQLMASRSTRPAAGAVPATSPRCWPGNDTWEVS